MPPSFFVCACVLQGDLCGPFLISRAFWLDAGGCTARGQDRNEPSGKWEKKRADNKQALLERDAGHAKHGRLLFIMLDYGNAEEWHASLATLKNCTQVWQCWVVVSQAWQRWKLTHKFANAEKLHKSLARLKSGTKVWQCWKIAQESGNAENKSDCTARAQNRKIQ